VKREDLEQYDMPDTPGVYRFYKDGKLLYVGKATSLRDRVRSYFASNLADGRGDAIVGMVADSDEVQWETAESVLEALILEANLIKQLQPPFNILEKSNRSFNYLVITKETFPRVLVVRGRDYFTNWQDGSVMHLFGPFPQGAALREAVKLVRRIFPFRDDKCTPCLDQKKAGKAVCRPCFNRQIGMCPGICTGETDAHEYANTIHNICLLFSGKKRALIKELEKEMQVAAKEERFEDAEQARRQVAALTHIRDISLIKNESRIAPGGNVPIRSSRIEAYDVAHTAGKETVGVVVVVEDGDPVKSAYRKFKVHGFENNDPGALSEILSRRLLHPEWQYPRIIVVDGSTAQMNAAKRVLTNAGISIPVVGVVKNEWHKPERLTGDQNIITQHERDILLANNEAHRFAINYHRKRQRRAML